MTHKLKALGPALLLTCALSAMAAQSASAATEHEFHAEKGNVVVTGNEENMHNLAVGAVGTVTCGQLATESTQKGTEVSTGTHKSDTIVVVPHYSECSFGGQPATVNFNHCYYEFDSDTTLGNNTNPGAEHANVNIQCEGEPARIEIHTAVCTVTVKPQTIKHAVRYYNIVLGDLTIEITAEKIVVDKSRTTATQPLNGCLTFPTNGSAVGSYTGDTLTACFEDIGSEWIGTGRTTPTGLTSEGEAVGCKVS